MAARQYLVRKDAYDARDHHAMRSLAPLPSAVNLSQYLGAVKDQGQMGSCTGNAGAGFLTTLFKAQQKSAYEFSALFLYAEERIKNGTFPEDSGSDSRTLMQVLNQYGCCLEQVDPYSDTAAADRPTDNMINAAARFKIGAYHRVLLGDSLATLKSVLASGYCVVIGVPVYQALESEQVLDTGVLPIPGPGETSIGGHEMLVYGYDDAQGVQLVRNSWGASWGKGGNLTMPYGYYDAVGGDAYCDSWVGHFGAPWKG